MLSLHELLSVVVSERRRSGHDFRRRLTLGTGIALPPELDAKATLQAGDSACLHITAYNLSL
eukprot:IDg8700t1